MSTGKRMSERQMRILRWFIVPFSRWNARRYLRSDGARMGRFLGRDICVVRMTGAVSGRRLQVPLMYVPHRQGVLLVASLGGAPKYHNLVKNPDIEVHVKGKSLKLRARLASASEKPELWPICVRHYPPYADYQARTDRDIPVFVCEPHTG